MSVHILLPTGSPLHRENCPKKIILVRENTGNLENLPKHRENKGNFAIFFSFSEFSAKSVLHIKQSYITEIVTGKICGWTEKSGKTQGV